ncbi:MAG: phosphohistidine swiveling domain-containing protein [Gammaproteobacteria bacterium]|jgi:phosphohistidine swiveling domain-containing protein
MWLIYTLPSIKNKKSPVDNHSYIYLRLKSVTSSQIRGGVIMSERTYEAPGPGCWELDTTHFSKPLSLFSASAIPPGSRRGFMEGTARYGLLISHMANVVIHGFNYSKMVMAFAPDDAPAGPPPEGYFEMPDMVARIEAGVEAIANKLWREDLRIWDEDIKPDSIRRNNTLQTINPTDLDIAALIDHINDCSENLTEMWYRHHRFTIPSLMPVGLYLAHASLWGGVTVNEALALLKGSTPVSLGIAAEDLKSIGKALNESGFDVTELEGLTAEEAMSKLRAINESIESSVARYIDLVGYQLTSGYDVTEKYLLEMPEILLANILAAAKILQNEAIPDQTDVSIIRNKIPLEHQEAFDGMLAEARLINRLRDERGIYNEARGYGLARRAIKEAGARLVADGRLPESELMVFAALDEMSALLNGATSPTSETLLERQDWYQTKTTDDAPAYIGSEPEPPPPLEALPEKARLGQMAIGAAIGQVFDPPEVEKREGIEVQGHPVSPGMFEGIARVIKGPEDFHRIKQGDVLITKNTAASFNVVLPIIGALVTDRGGQLSHAAIVAREYGIPGIVSTRDATRQIPDGARVRVDGSSGTVEVLK